MNTDDLRLTLTAVFEPAPDTGFTCHFEEFPGVFSQGETVDEAKVNLFDALKQLMEYHGKEARKHTAPGEIREEFHLATL